MSGDFNAVRQVQGFWRFWLESLGQSPGLTRDMDLPVASAPPPVALGQCLPATWTVQPAMSAAERELADQMAWGFSLEFSDAPSQLRVSM